MPRLPLIEDLTKLPIPPGYSILVEYDPASQWFYASLTIAAGWVKSGGVASYNVFDHPPETARLQLNKLGLDVETLEKEEKLRIIDVYTSQLGKKSQEKYAINSMRVADHSIMTSRQLTSSPFPGTGWRLGPDVLRIGDDESVLIRFNDEKSFIDYWRTRVIPTGLATKSTQISAAVKDVYSEYVYKSLESSVDGIVDVKIDEEGGEVKNLMRIRSMRGVGYDSRWHHFKIGDNFEITLEK